MECFYNDRIAFMCVSFQVGQDTSRSFHSRWLHSWLPFFMFVHGCSRSVPWTLPSQYARQCRRDTWDKTVSFNVIATAVKVMLCMIPFRVVGFFLCLPFVKLLVVYCCFAFLASVCHAGPLPSVMVSLIKHRCSLNGVPMQIRVQEW